jgi:hypothetical protein
MRVTYKALIAEVRYVVLGLATFLRWPARANEDSPVGTWKLVSYISEDVQTKERRFVYGEHPNGYAVLTSEGRLIAIITAEGRKVPQTAEDRDSAFRSVVAYSGQYRLDGSKFATKVDIAWNEAWVGTDQVRFFRLEGDRLHIETAPASNLDFSGRMERGILVWEQERK